MDHHPHDRSDGTDIGAVVADIGAHSAKLGFAGEDTPRALFSSVCMCAGVWVWSGAVLLRT